MGGMSASMNSCRDVDVDRVTLGQIFDRSDNRK